MSLEFNANLHPPLGHVFKNTDGVKFRGTSWANVAEKVTEYRVTNGFPVGDVLAEIIAQVCKSSPSYCRDSSAPVRNSRPARPRQPDAVHPKPAGAQPKLGMVARVTTWVHKLLAFKRKTGLNFVPKTESKRRLSICAACPKLTSVTGSCGGCMATLAQAKGILLSGQAKAEKAISGCKALGEDVSVSAYLTQPPSSEPSLPVNCWRRGV